MSSSRLLARSSRALLSCPRTSSRAFSSAPSRLNQPNSQPDFTEFNKRGNDTAPEYRRFQIEKPLNPHFTNTTSTIANEMPSVGSDAAPPELIKNTDGGFAPKDAVPGNTERMTGGTQGSKDKDVPAANKGIAGVSSKRSYSTRASAPPSAEANTGEQGELGVGEMEGVKLRIEPLRRTGEDAATTRARLMYQSRKRGTLESDLLLSTFADAYLGTMPPHLLKQYDLFLDENDWDIYYWATQEPSPTSLETAEGQGSDLATPAAQGKDEWKRQPASGEWAQTVGTFKPAYRPVPTRWKGSEILALLRRHVKEKSAGGVTDGEAQVDGSIPTQRVKGSGVGGLGMMPEIKQFD